jgi:hypothetical protein
MVLLSDKAACQLIAEDNSSRRWSITVTYHNKTWLSDHVMTSAAQYLIKSNSLILLQ